MADLTEPVSESAGNARRAIWQRRMGTAAAAVTAVLAPFAFAGYAGHSSWVFDLTNHFRVQTVIGLSLCVLALALTRRKRTAIAATIAAVCAVWPVAREIAARPAAAVGDERLRVMELNVWARNGDFDRTEALIREISPDVVLLVEIDERWVQTLARLKADWPYAVVTLGTGHLGIGLFSKRPIEEGRVTFLNHVVAIVHGRIDVAGEPVTFAGVHLSRPLSAAGTARQRTEMIELAELLGSTPGPAVVLGDFNSVPWSAAATDFRSRAGLRDTRQGLGQQASWPAFLPAPLRIPIDHCLVSGDLQAAHCAIGPSVGSDHLPVIVELVRSQAK